MTVEIYIVLAILICTVALLIFELVRVDVVAIISMLALGWAGILTPHEMFSGFSSNAVIAMIAIMIMGYGIAKTGFMDRYSNFVVKKFGKRKKRTIAFMSLSVGLVSGFILNIGAAALFLPSAIYVSRKLEIPLSIIIMPLGFAAILGGSITMIGSGHLILVNDILQTAGLETYNIYSVAPIGLALLAAGIIYFFFAGKFVLPPKVNNKSKLTEQEKLIKELGLPNNITYYSITPDSAMVNKTSAELNLHDKYRVNIVGTYCKEKVLYSPWRETKFEEGQNLALLGSKDELDRFVKEFKLKPISQIKHFECFNDPDAAGFAEVIVRPRSEYIGQEMKKLSLRRRFGVEPIRIFSKGEELKGDFAHHTIVPGDTIIVYGLWDRIKEMRNFIDFVITTPIDIEKKEKGKSFTALACLLGALGAAIAGFSIPMAFLTGAVAMMLTGVINITQAYKAVEWKVVFLIAGLIPLGVAMQKTGAAELIARQIMIALEHQHPLLILTVIGVIATMFSLFMSNIGAFLVIAPLVISLAGMLDFNPGALVLFAGICVSNSFMLPTQQVNALYMSPGGYKIKDYLKAGTGLSLLFIIIVVLLFYFFYL